MQTQAWINENAAHFAAVISHPGFGNGPRAELRRMRPDAPSAPAFWRLLAARGMLGGVNTEDEAKWGLILHGIALMTGNAGAGAFRSAHSPAIGVGWALYTGGDDGRANAYYSDARLTKLLNARGAIRISLIARMCRMMASAKATFDWQEMARFIYFDRADPRYEDYGREVGDSIVRSYYVAERIAGSNGAAQPD